MRTFLVGLILSGIAIGQTATVQGVVSDPSGAVVPTASIVLNGRGGARTGSTDISGRYSFEGLVPGKYTIQATAPNLSMGAPANLTVHAGAQTLDLRLLVSVTTKQVEVRDDAGNMVRIDPSSNASALVLRGDDLSALSDNPDDLAADLQALAGPAAGPNGGAIFIDGFSGGEIPPKESIREIRINQDPFSAEYDKLGYGRIEIFTKPGSNKYHATVDYNFANDFWNSRNPYSAVKAPLTLHEFEGGGSGPLGKRASFTLDAQHNRVDNGAVTNAITLNTQTLAQQPYSSIFTVPQRYTRLTPRLDYQLDQNNTLSLRYGFTHADINGAGIGSFDLPTRGHRTTFANQLLQFTETAVIGTAINETRFQYYRNAMQLAALDSSPTLQVLGSFIGGGSQLGQSSDTQSSYEFQNYTGILHGTHNLRFGLRLRGLTDDSVSPLNFNGTYIFGGGPGPVLNAANQAVPGQFEQITSIERYRRTLLFQKLGYSPAEIRARGGGATQFSISAGTAGTSSGQIDMALFVGDTWALQPNVTISYGVRYELQTNMRDWRDIAPRLSVAWAPSLKSQRKTVIRAGFGTFYDRYALANTLAVERFNGTVQQQFVVPNPETYPAIPSLAALSANRSGQVIQLADSTLRAPYILQSAITVERQLASNTTATVTYTNSRGLHLLRSRDITAPSASAQFLIESTGIYNQNQLISSVNTKAGTKLSLFGFYVLNKAMSDTDGVGTSPANPYSRVGEYGPAATDVRHRGTIGGSIVTRYNIRVSPFVILQSGAPFNITTGSDVYGTTMFNARPGIATDTARPGLVQTTYGLLDPSPIAGEKILSRNAGRGPNQFTVNLRLAKTIGFGPAKEGSKPQAAAAPTAGQSQNAAITGQGMRNILGTTATARRYNLIISMSVRNLLNHNNPGPITGNITSPLFGRANQIAGAPNGEGFSEAASNRRLEMQIRLTF